MISQADDNFPFYFSFSWNFYATSLLLETPETIKRAGSS